MPHAVVGERHNLAAVMFANVTLVAGIVLVNVVAKVKNQVEFVLCHPVVGSVVALFEALAGGRSKGELFWVGEPCWHRTCSAHDTFFTVYAELEPIPCVRFELPGGYVDRVPQLRRGELLPGGRDVLHAVIRGQSPLDRDTQVWHAAVRVEWFGREPGPEYHACAVGVPGGHTQ